MWDKAAVIANFLLVAVGIAGVVVAIKTLRKIERQTKAGEEAAKSGRDSAEASLKQANALIDAERAWVVESIRFLDEIPYRSNDGGILVAQVTLRNIGKQPAFLKFIQLRFHAHDTALARLPQYRSTEPLPDGFMMAPSSEIHLRALLEEGSFDDEQVQRIRGLKGKALKLRLYGRIAYESMGREGVNQFCYTWQNQMGFSLSGDKPFFEKDGPLGYNSHT